MTFHSEPPPDPLQSLIEGALYTLAVVWYIVLCLVWRLLLAAPYLVWINVALRHHWRF